MGNSYRVGIFDFRFRTPYQPTLERSHFTPLTLRHFTPLTLRPPIPDKIEC